MLYAEQMRVLEANLASSATCPPRHILFGAPLQTPLFAYVHAFLPCNVMPCQFASAQGLSDSIYEPEVLVQEVRQGAVQAPDRSQTGGTNQWDHDLQPVKVSCLQKRFLALLLPEIAKRCCLIFVRLQTIPYSVMTR